MYNIPYYGVMTITNVWTFRGHHQSDKPMLNYVQILKDSQKKFLLDFVMQWKFKDFRKPILKAKKPKTLQKNDIV